MKTVLWAIYGVAMSVVFVFLVGVLSIQAIGLEAGAVFDLNNVVVAVTSPRLPLLPMLSTAALSGLVMYSLTIGVRNRARPCRLAFSAGFGAATALIVALSLLVASTRDHPNSSLPVGVAPGWEGWLQEGGSNPAVHVLLLVSVGALWWAYRGERGTAVGSSAETPTEAAQL